MKKLFAGMSAVAITVTQVGVAVAAYTDVPAGVWYEDAVDAFRDAGYLDASQTRFRGGDKANRAEFTKLVVELNGGILSTPPAVPSFDDVKPGAWYYGYMEEAGKEGWVKGDNNCYGSHPCYARPAANINRAEAAALIVRAFGLDATGDAPSFVDVPSGQWYTSVMQTAADHCVIQGDDTTGRARPADFMNRAEMVVMLNRVDQGLTYGVDCEMGGVNEPMIKDVTPTSENTVEVEFSVALDEDAATDASKYMVSGDADIDVSSVDMLDDMTVELTLADSTDAGSDYTLSVEDMMTANGKSFSDSMDFSGYTEIEQGDGILEVSVASTNPAADTVPQGAQGVVLASVDLTASCDDDVVISELTVLHEGYGAASDITGVYAAIDGARVTRKRTLNSQDQTATLRFTDPLTIRACKTVTVDLVADFDTSLSAGAEHNLAIELPSDFQSNARDVDGNFPIRGNTFRIAAVTSGTVTLTYRTISPSTTEVGKKTQVVGKFEVRASATEDQTLYSITLEQNGTASDGDISNIRIRRSDGTVLTNTVSSTKSDYATLIFDPPFTVLQGQNVTFEVVADINGGASETIIFQLEETSDLFAVGSLYGYGKNGQLYGSRVSTSGSAATVTIDAGKLTIEIDGPTQQKYTADDDDAVLAKVLMTAGDEAVDIQDLFFIIKGQTSTGANLSNGGDTASDTIAEVLEDVELRNTKTGQTISAVRSTVSGHAGTGGSGGDQFTFQVYRFDDFIVQGSTTWELRVDFIDAGVHPANGDRFRTEVCTDASSGCTFGAGITASTTKLVAEGESTGDTITDVRPGVAVAGNYHRIAAPGLTVSVKSIGATETAVKNTKNVNLFRFEARAGEAEDILLTATAFEAAAGSLLNAQNYTLWVDTDGDGNVDTILEKGVAASSNTVTFDDLAGGGYVVPADETVVFEVHADIASSLTNSTLQIEFADTNAATTYVEAEQVDNGSSLTLGTDITVSTTFTGKTYTLVSAGDLFVIRDDVVRSRQLLGGTLADEALRLNFRAVNEDVDVTKLQISTSGSLVGADSIDRVELYKAGDTTAFASATLGACGSDTLIGQASQGERTFCANMQSQQFVVKKGENVDVLVRPRVKTDENGARSSSGFLLWTGTGAVQARGLNSSTTLIINDNDSSSDGEIVIGPNSYATNTQIRGNNNEVVLSKITSITNANPDASNTNIPIGTYPLGQFRFTAASNSNTKNGANKATLTGVIFTITSTNVNMSGSAFRFYNKADASTKASCDAVSSTNGSGSLRVNCPNLDDSSVNTAIDSGASSTFVLEGVVENPQVTTTVTSTLQVSIQNFSSISNTTYGNTASNLVWADKDTASRTFFWIESPETVVNSTSYRT